MIREGSTVRLGDPKNHALMIVGRLRPGISRDAVPAMLASLSESLERADPLENKNHELLISQLSRTSISNRPQTDTSLSVLSMLLMGTAALVLLIACLNLANMMLARGTSRRKEIALRLALGSGRARVVRQLLTESLLLAGLGSVVGLLLAMWSASLLVRSLASAIPFVVTLDHNPDIRVLGATVGFCVLSTVIAGLGPAWRITRPDVLPDLKGHATEEGGGRRFSMRNALVVGQIALSLALLTAAGLFMRGALKASVADPGFPVDGSVIANLDPGMIGYDETRARAAHRSILRRVRSTPGVRSASFASLVPFGEFQEGERVQKAGTSPAPPGQPEEGVSATYTIVGADYFETLQLPVLRGRGFTAAEEESSAGPRVAIVDEPLARQLFADDDPVGREIQFAARDRATPASMVVVGVVKGVRHDLFDRVPVPHVYVPLGQHYRGNMNLHVRLAASGASLEAAMLNTVRQEIRAADNQVPVLQLRTMRQQRDKNLLLWTVNAGARLFSVFGGVALLLAVIGVYGVKSYVVSRRTREIGIRMALGATPTNVQWLVLREGLTLTGYGIGFGLLMAWGVAKALSGMLYEVSAADPIVFTVAPVLLTGSALAATYLPARRATRVLPVTALRAE
jgi:predicted permease